MNQNSVFYHMRFKGLRYIKNLLSPKVILLLLLFLAFLKTFPQRSIKKYVKANTIQVSSIDPSFTPYDDIKAIGDAIGDARIVMLGENDHGDAPSFLARTRIIKYLVEQKGFTVVAFESSFYSLNAGWTEGEKDWEKAKAFLRQNTLGVWAACKQCDPLYNYLAEKLVSNIVQVTGFDIQHHGSVFWSGYSEQLKQFLDTSLILPKQSEKGMAFSQNWDKFFTYFKNQSLAPDSIWQKVHQPLENFYQKAKEIYGEKNFWCQELSNLISAYELFIAMTIKPNGSWINFNIRDKEMANNLKWLARYKYPHSKIIICAASGHLARKYPIQPTRTKLQVMGEWLARDTAFKHSTYFIGFTPLEGRAGRVGSLYYDIPAPKKESFESWIATINPDYAFVDFKGFRALRKNYKRRFYMNGVSNRNIKFDWTNVFDGMFYIKEMYPCNGKKKTT